ncbi:hypothetical protein EVAR_94904_1 [Eumeta japonica]|uniref:Uncharacterized protein n=1 Tax=Eumeta variegata TaxID=151549 RepID=A0A4C1V9F8_EUMVA|nr:hypothetical protein EVAR_94904_1 [Eumeta japonica]
MYELCIRDAPRPTGSAMRIDEQNGGDHASACNRPSGELHRFFQHRHVIILRSCSSKLLNPRSNSTTRVLRRNSMASFAAGAGSRGRLALGTLKECTNLSRARVGDVCPLCAAQCIDDVDRRPSGLLAGAGARLALRGAVAPGRPAPRGSALDAPPTPLVARSPPRSYGGSGGRPARHGTQLVSLNISWTEYARTECFELGKRSRLFYECQHEDRLHDLAILCLSWALPERTLLTHAYRPLSPWPAAAR